jgi:hypothetical protein
MGSKGSPEDRARRRERERLRREAADRLAVSALVWRPNHAPIAGTDAEVVLGDLPAPRLGAESRDRLGPLGR